MHETVVPWDGSGKCRRMVLYPERSWQTSSLHRIRSLGLLPSMPSIPMPS